MYTKTAEEKNNETRNPQQKLKYWTSITRKHLKHLAIATTKKNRKSKIWFLESFLQCHFHNFLSGCLLLIIIRWASVWRGERPIDKVSIGNLKSPQSAQVGSCLKFFWQNVFQGKTWGACDGAQCKGKTILPRFKYNWINPFSFSIMYFKFLLL